MSAIKSCPIDLYTSLDFESVFEVYKCAVFGLLVAPNVLLQFKILQRHVYPSRPEVPIIRVGVVFVRSREARISRYQLPCSILSSLMESPIALKILALCTTPPKPPSSQSPTPTTRNKSRLACPNHRPQQHSRREEVHQMRRGSLVEHPDGASARHPSCEEEWSVVQGGEEGAEGGS